MPYIAIEHAPFEGDRVLGAYPSFEAARDDIETRTAADAALEYPRDYGIKNAVIENWEGALRLNVFWERDYRSPLNWIQRTD